MLAGKVDGKCDFNEKWIAVKARQPLCMLEPTGGIEPPTC
jgi:hypothetical protein